jgi:hypothetical protein
MGIWEKLFGTKSQSAEGSKVTFLREESRPAMKGSSKLATYRYYKAANAEAALEFLNKQEVKEEMFYVDVEAPDGRWVKDHTGLYLYDA